MASEHHIFCGGIGPRNVASDPTRLMLNLWNNQPGCNVRLTIEDLHEQFFKNSPPQFHDLLEIATYIFCADQALTRGARDVQTMGENWRRQIKVVHQIPTPAFIAKAAKHFKVYRPNNVSPDVPRDIGIAGRVFGRQRCGARARWNLCATGAGERAAADDSSRALPRRSAVRRVLGKERSAGKEVKGVAENG